METWSRSHSAPVSSSTPLVGYEDRRHLCMLICPTGSSGLTSLSFCLWWLVLPPLASRVPSRRCLRRRRSTCPLLSKKLSRDRSPSSSTILNSSSSCIRDPIYASKCSCCILRKSCWSLALSYLLLWTSASSRLFSSKISLTSERMDTAGIDDAASTGWYAWMQDRSS